MNEINELISQVFIINKDDKEITYGLKDFSKIPLLIAYLQDRNNTTENKLFLLQLLYNIFKENNLSTIYFESINNKSIYYYLIDLYLSENKSNSESFPSFQKLILEIIQLLINYISINKNIIKYIYNKLSLIYRKKEEISTLKINNYLKLINALYGNTDSAITPKNYFVSFGHGSLTLNFEETENNILNLFNPILIHISFKIYKRKNKEFSNLVTLTLSNNQKIIIYFKYPNFIYLTNRCMNVLPMDQWANLIIILTVENDKLYINLAVNGENKTEKMEVANIKIEQNMFIKSIDFFDGFTGQFTSIMIMNQNNLIPNTNTNTNPNEIDNNNICTLLNENFLLLFKKFPYGFYKEITTETLYDILSEFSNNDLRKSKKKKNNSLFDDIITLITPYCTKNTYARKMEISKINLSKSIKFKNESKYILNVDLTGKIKYQLNKDLIVHKYKCYQKNILVLGGICNLLPILEMMFINKSIMTEEILNNYLIIIKNILDGRKDNIKDAKENFFFEILSIFLEKLNEEIYTENIIFSISNIAKVIFSTDLISISSTFFEYIFLNKKILSKFSQGLQNKLWCEVTKFCQSDKTQIETFINMKNICLILRAYDEEKYSKFCCEEHYNQLRNDEEDDNANINNNNINNNKKPNIMEPTMKEKLSNLTDLMLTIIDSQTEDNSINLIKLLILDISPCLTKFIINIFTNALKKGNKEWSSKFINKFFKEKCETIICNACRHSLLDVRIDIISFLYEMHKNCEQKIMFAQVERKFKTCLIPEDMFYSQENNLSINASDIKKLALHCVSKIEKNIFNSSCNIFKGYKLIFKDNVYNDYLNSVLKIFLLWSIGKDINSDIYKIDFSKENFKFIPIFKILLFFLQQLQDIKLLIKFYKYFLILINNDANCQKIIKDKVVISWLLSTCYESYKKDDKDIINIYNCSKEIILNIYLSPLKIYSDFNNNYFPFNDLELIFTWGDKVRAYYNEDYVIDFMQRILEDILKGTSKLINKTDFHRLGELTYVQKNFLILITYIFQFIFHYKLENVFLQKNMNLVYLNEDSFISMPEIYILGIRIDGSESQKIEDIWKDYIFYKEIFNFFSPIWSKENTYKKISFKRGKHKVLRYETIIKNIILNESVRNLYLNELRFLCYSNLDDYLSTSKIKNCYPLIYIIPISLGNILIAIRNLAKNQDQYLEYLTELKHFIFYILISSSNLSQRNQEEFYNQIQEKCMNVIALVLVIIREEILLFRKSNNDSKNSNPIEAKLKKTLHSIITFCLVLINYQYTNLDVTKGFFRKSFKSKNDLTRTAVFRLFNEYLVDKKSLPILTPDKVKKYSCSQYISICDVVLGDEWKNSIFKNIKLKSKLNNELFNLNKYHNLVVERYEILEQLNNEYDDGYKTLFINYVKKYQFGLDKDASDLFIQMKMAKNKYKQIKKCLFSWNGFWSDYNLFYNNPDKLKLKVLNHYTRSYMKPCLIPIIDINYYLPDFVSFDINDLFKDENKENEFKLSLNIDSVILGTDKNNISNENISNISNNYLKLIYKKSNAGIMNLYNEISSNIEVNFDELLSNLYKRKSTVVDEEVKKTEPDNYFLCCLVKESHHLKGVLFIEENKIIFKVFLNQKFGSTLTGVDIGFSQLDEDYDEERETCFGSYFVRYHKDLDKINLEIDYDNIDIIFRRQYYYKHSAIEIYTKQNKDFYFNFKLENIREKALKLIINNINDYAVLVDDLRNYKDNFDNILGYLSQDCSLLYYGGKKPNSKIKKIKISKQIETWTEWKISNFQLIMLFNIYANRSYTDISQYPVLPWILSKYDDPIQEIKEGQDKEDYIYRDLSLPIGMLDINEESSKRKENFIEIYESLIEENNPDIVPYVYGTHYSNPFYVTNFLVRVFPYTHIGIELQGQKFDNANRLFFSVSETFYNTTTQNANLRELIPEFYFLPEIFINHNNLNLGIKDNDEVVHNVLTPFNDPYLFVMHMRKALESEYASYNIGKWIDLIFGFKQKGKEAHLAYNVFYQSSYLDSVDLSQIKDKVSFFRLVEFGLTPIQIVNGKEMPCRISKDTILKGQRELIDGEKNINVFKCKNNNSLNFIDILSEQCFVIKCQCFDNDKICVLYSNYIVQIIKISNSKTGIDNISIVNKINPLNKIKAFANIKDGSVQNLFYNKGKNIAMAGFYGSEIKLISNDSSGTDVNLYPDIYGTITAVELDKEEELLFCGNIYGYIIVYKKYNNAWINKPFKILFDSDKKILCLNCNSELNILASSSMDSLINLYTLPGCLLFRSIKLVNDLVGNKVFLSSCPLPSVVILCEKSICQFYIYSINGKLLYNTKEDVVISPIMFRDLEFNEYLAYISTNKTIIIRDIPLFKVNSSIYLNDDISQLCISGDMKTLYGITNNGSDVLIIRDQK